MPSKKSLKRIEGGSKKRKRKGRHYNVHDKYYQALYNNFYKDHAADIISARDRKIDDIKEQISKLNHNTGTSNNEISIKELTDLQKQLERQNVLDQQMASSLKIGNDISIPLAKDLREVDDQRIFGSSLYANSNIPNYMEIANQQKMMKAKLAQYMSDPINQMKMAQQSNMVYIFLCYSIF